MTLLTTYIHYTWYSCLWLCNYIIADGLAMQGLGISFQTQFRNDQAELFQGVAKTTVNGTSMDVQLVQAKHSGGDLDSEFSIIQACAVE